MKLLAVLVSMFVSSAAFAVIKDQCVVTVTDGSATTSTLLDMEMVQHPRADIVGYRLNTVHEGFHVFVTEADGNFYGRVTASTGAYTEDTVVDQSLSLAIVDGAKSLYMECF
jgi:hypothetical protein